MAGQQDLSRSSHLVRWSWVAIALTPVGVLVAGVVGVAFSPDSGSGSKLLPSLPVYVVALLAPTAGVVMSRMAAHAGRAARAPFVTSLVLVAAMFVLLPAIGVGSVLSRYLALAAVAALFAGVERRHHRHTGHLGGMRGHPVN